MKSEKIIRIVTALVAYIAFTMANLISTMWCFFRLVFNKIRYGEMFMSPVELVRLTMENYIEFYNVMKQFVKSGEVNISKD